MLWARLALATGIQIPFMNRRDRTESHKKAFFLSSIHSHGTGTAVDIGRQ
jgi:hypothetical protein